MEFSYLQIIGAASFPVSFFSLVMGTIVWHFHINEVILDNLRWKRKGQVMPFFFFIIIQKVWVVADLCSKLSMVSEEAVPNQALLTLLQLFPITLIIAMELMLHVWIGFPTRSTILGSMANLTTLWRPTHDECKNALSLRFYRYETVLTSIMYIVFALSSLAINYYFLMPTSFLDDIETLSAFTSLALACVCLVITQMYTYWFAGTLFPKHFPIEVTYCVDITYGKNISDFVKSGRTERGHRDSRDKSNDIDMSIMKKQITPETEAGKVFIPRDVCANELTCSADEISNPVSVENNTEGDDVADLNAIHTVYERETCQGAVEETESQSPDTKFGAEHGSNENLTQTFCSKFMTRFTPFKGFVKKAKQGETWILATYILSLMTVVGVNSYFYHDIRGKLPGNT